MLETGIRCMESREGGVRYGNVQLFLLGVVNVFFFFFFNGIYVGGEF